MNDTVEPYLWSDEEVLGYIDESQEWFCRRVQGITDSITPAVCRVSVLPGTTWIDLDPRVLEVVGVRRGDNGRTVEMVDRTRLTDYDERPGYFRDVRGIVLGESDGKMRIVPGSNETVTLWLTVRRLPLEPITSDLQKFEIAERHHRHLLLYQRALAYSKDDAEAKNAEQASLFFARFERYCEQAKREIDSLPNITRVVQYGGI